MKTITLSSENIYSYRTKQEGYGRQGLYLSLYNLDGAPDQEIYWGSTFPNPREHWRLHTDEEASSKLQAISFDDDGEPISFEEIDGEYVDCSGNDIDADRIFPTIFDGIVAMVSGYEVEVEEPNEDDEE